MESTPETHTGSVPAGYLPLDTGMARLDISARRQSTGLDAKPASARSDSSAAHMSTSPLPSAPAPLTNGTHTNSTNPNGQPLPSPAASSLMGGLAADMQARILALQASRPRRQSSSCKTGIGRNINDELSRNSSCSSISSTSSTTNTDVDSCHTTPTSSSAVSSPVAAPSAVLSGPLTGAVPSGALAFSRNPSALPLKRATSLSERRGVKLNPASLPRPGGPGHTSHPAHVPNVMPGVAPANGPGLGGIIPQRIPVGHRRTPSNGTFRIPESPVPSAGAAARRPKLALQDTQSPGVIGVKNSAPPDPRAYNSLFSTYKKYIDIETGSLNFAGKAVLHSNGIDFSSGTSFRITLDELEPLSELGAGNYGTVTKVLHKPTNVTMAMKEIRLELEEANFQQIIMELDVLHRCQLNHIVEFYGAFFVESAVYVCMEYMDGGSINQIYEQGIPEKELAYITHSVILALKQLKDDYKIIHRDVKPTNILCSTAGLVKLCDFGVSGNLVASIAKTNIGCHAYMAPERIRTNAATQSATYTVESDVWSLGLSIIEMADGNYPYPPESYSNIFSQLSAIVDGNPPELDPKRFSPEACSFVSMCLDKNPRSRPTYQELLQHPWLADLNYNQEDMAQFVTERLASLPQKNSP